jgi:hypothetical protein
MGVLTGESPTLFNVSFPSRMRLLKKVTRFDCVQGIRHFQESSFASFDDALQLLELGCESAADIDG